MGRIADYRLRVARPLLEVANCGLLGILLLLCFALSSHVQAQLSVASDLHPNVLDFSAGTNEVGVYAERNRSTGAKLVGFKRSVLSKVNPVNILSSTSTTVCRQPVAFDFSKSAPYLAFFCRLEINEKKGGVIPAKFRLGGHRYWQDNLIR